MLLRKKINAYTKKVLGKGDLKDRFLDYLADVVYSFTSRFYQGQGIRDGAIVGDTSQSDAFGFLDSTGPDTPGEINGVDGNGKEMELTDGDHSLDAFGSWKVPFANANGIWYWVGLKANEMPYYDPPVDPGALQPLETNPVTGQPAYTSLIDITGEVGHPDDVEWDSGTGQLILEVTDLTEAGESHAMRQAIVYLDSPVSTNHAIAFKEVLVDWNADGDNKNKVRFVGDLGQQAAGLSVSTDPDDYWVVIPGPTCRRNTDLSLDGDYCILGKVEGGGAGNPPSSYDLSAQRRLDLSFGDNAANIETLGKDIYKDPVSMLDGDGLMNFNQPIEYWWEQEHRQDGYGTPGERYTHSDITPDSVKAKQKAGWSKIIARATSSGDAVLGKIGVHDYSTNAWIGGIHGDGKFITPNEGQFGAGVFPGSSLKAHLIEEAGASSKQVMAFKDENITTAVRLSHAGKLTNFSEMPEEGIVPAIAWNYRRRKVITVGNGSTNFGDYNGASEIKTAIESQKGNEQPVSIYIKAGSYTINNGPIVIPSNVMIYGDGIGTKLLNGSASEYIFDIPQVTTGADGQCYVGDQYTFQSSGSTFQTDGVEAGDYLVPMGIDIFGTPYVNTDCMDPYRIGEVLSETQLKVQGRTFGGSHTDVYFAILKHGVEIHNLQTYAATGKHGHIRANVVGGKFTNLFMRRNGSAYGLYLVGGIDCTIENIHGEQVDHLVSLGSNSQNCVVNNVVGLDCNQVVVVSGGTEFFGGGHSVSNVSGQRCENIIYGTGSGFTVNNISSRWGRDDAVYLHSAAGFSVSGVASYYDYGSAVHVDSCYACTLSNITSYYNRSGAGLNISAGDNGISVSNVVINQSVGQGVNISSLTSTNGKPASFSNVIVYNAGNGAGSYSGFYLTQIDNVSFDGCGAFGCTNQGWNINLSDKVKFANCFGFKNDGAGFSWDEGSMSFSNCEASENVGRGFQDTGTSSDCTFTSCIAENNGSGGFYLNGYMTTTSACLARGNDGNGFANYGGGSHSYVGCIAIGNDADGFHLVEKSACSNCLAQSNGEEGFFIDGQYSKITDCEAWYNDDVGFGVHVGDVALYDNIGWANSNYDFKLNGYVGIGFKKFGDINTNVTDNNEFQTFTGS